MSERQIIIVKNYQTSDIMIEDLGKNMTAGSSINFTDIFKIYIILASRDLYNYVSNGDLVINDGTEDLDIEVAKDFLTINTIGNESNINDTTKDLFSLQFYENDVDSYSWVDQWPNSGNSGPDDGFAGGDEGFPFVIPFNCKLSYIDVFFSGAEYTDRGTNPGNLYFDLALSRMYYNEWIWARTYRFTLPGSFTNNAVSNNSFKFSEPSFIMPDIDIGSKTEPQYNQESLIKPRMYALSFENISDQIGQINRFRNIMIKTVFERI